MTTGLPKRRPKPTLGMGALNFGTTRCQALTWIRAGCTPGAKKQPRASIFVSWVNQQSQSHRIAKTLRHTKTRRRNLNPARQPSKPYPITAVHSVAKPRSISSPFPRSWRITARAPRIEQWPSTLSTSLTDTVCFFPSLPPSYILVQADQILAECIYSRTWLPPPAPPSQSSADGLHNPPQSQTLSAKSSSDNAKLIFGTVFSLRNMVRKLGGDDDAFISFRTAQYKLHYYETASNLRLVMLTDTSTLSMRNVLHQIYINLWVEYVVKNPLSPVEHKGGEGVRNELFEMGLDQFVRGLM